MCHAIYSDLAFLHSFKQRSLRFGCSTIDLVCQNDLSNHRPGAEFKLAFLLVKNRYAGYVAGEHIRRKLNAIEGAIQ